MSPPAVLVVGATSVIAERLARLYASEGARLFLIGRHARLETIAADLRIRGAGEVQTALLDLNDPVAARTALATCREAFGRPDVVVMAHGTLTDQAKAEQDPAYARAELDTNFVGPVGLLLELAAWYEPDGQGVIAVITSVAGMRGRASNFVYGAAKGGLQVFLEGLRHRLHRTGTQVLDVRPGFVDTPMTAHLAKGGPLWATPERVASDIHRAIGSRRAVLYTPWFWRWILLLICSLPRFLFHKLRI